MATTNSPVVSVDCLSSSSAVRAHCQGRFVDDQGSVPSQKQFACFQKHLISVYEIGATEHMEDEDDAPRPNVDLTLVYECSYFRGVCEAFCVPSSALLKKAPDDVASSIYDCMLVFHDDRSWDLLCWDESNMRLSSILHGVCAVEKQNMYSPYTPTRKPVFCQNAESPNEILCVYFDGLLHGFSFEGSLSRDKAHMNVRLAQSSAFPLQLRVVNGHGFAAAEEREHIIQLEFLQRQIEFVEDPIIGILYEEVHAPMDVPYVHFVTCVVNWKDSAVQAGPWEIDNVHPETSLFLHTSTLLVLLSPSGAIAFSDSGEHTSLPLSPPLSLSLSWTPRSCRYVSSTPTENSYIVQDVLSRSFYELRIANSKAVSIENSLYISKVGGGDRERERERDVYSDFVVLREERERETKRGVIHLLGIGPTPHGACILSLSRQLPNSSLSLSGCVYTPSISVPTIGPISAIRNIPRGAGMAEQRLLVASQRKGLRFPGASLSTFEYGVKLLRYFGLENRPIAELSERAEIFSLSSSSRSLSPSLSPGSSGCVEDRLLILSLSGSNTSRAISLHSGDGSIEPITVNGMEENHRTLSVGFMYDQWMIQVTPDAVVIIEFEGEGEREGEKEREVRRWHPSVRGERVSIDHSHILQTSIILSSRTAIFVLDINALGLPLQRCCVEFCAEICAVQWVRRSLPSENSPPNTNYCAGFGGEGDTASGYSRGGNASAGNDGESLADLAMIACWGETSVYLAHFSLPVSAESSTRGEETLQSRDVIIGSVDVDETANVSSILAALLPPQREIEGEKKRKAGPILFDKDGDETLLAEKQLLRVLIGFSNGNVVLSTFALSTTTPNSSSAAPKFANLSANGPKKILQPTVVEVVEEHCVVAVGQAEVRFQLLHFAGSLAVFALSNDCVVVSGAFSPSLETVCPIRISPHRYPDAPVDSVHALSSLSVIYTSLLDGQALIFQDAKSHRIYFGLLEDLPTLHEIGSVDLDRQFSVPEITAIDVCGFCVDVSKVVSLLRKGREGDEVTVHSVPGMGVLCRSNILPDLRGHEMTVVVGERERGREGEREGDSAVRVEEMVVVAVQNIDTDKWGLGVSILCEGNHSDAKVTYPKAVGMHLCPEDLGSVCSLTPLYTPGSFSSSLSLSPLNLPSLLVVAFDSRIELWRPTLSLSLPALEIADPLPSLSTLADGLFEEDLGCERPFTVAFERLCGCEVAMGPPVHVSSSIPESLKASGNTYSSGSGSTISNTRTTHSGSSSAPNSHSNGASIAAISGEDVQPVENRKAGSSSGGFGVVIAASDALSNMQLLVATCESGRTPTGDPVWTLRVRSEVNEMEVLDAFHTNGVVDRMQSLNPFVTVVSFVSGEKGRDGCLVVYSDGTSTLWLESDIDTSNPSYLRLSKAREDRATRMDDSTFPLETVEDHRFLHRSVESAVAATISPPTSAAAETIDDPEYWRQQIRNHLKGSREYGEKTLAAVSAWRWGNVSISGVVDAIDVRYAVVEGSGGNWYSQGIERFALSPRRNSILYGTDDGTVLRVSTHFPSLSHTYSKETEVSLSLLLDLQSALDSVVDESHPTTAGRCRFLEAWRASNTSSKSPDAENTTILPPAVFLPYVVDHFLTMEKDESESLLQHFGAVQNRSNASNNSGSSSMGNGHSSGSGSRRYEEIVDKVRAVQRMRVAVPCSAAVLE